MVFAVIVALFVGGLIALVGGGFISHSLNRAGMPAKRAAVVANYVAQFGLHDAVRLHDRALVTLVDSYNHGWGPEKDDENLFKAHLESVVALRDRCDELLGKCHGHPNRSEIRVKMVVATGSITLETPLFDKCAVKMEFRIGQEFPDEADAWLSRHLKLMEQIYFQPSESMPV